MSKPHAAAVKFAETREAHPARVWAMAEAISHEYQPLVDAVKKAIRDIRYTQAISGNGWVATELERALSRVVGEPK